MSIFERPDSNFKSNSVAKTFLREFNCDIPTPEKAIYSPVFNWIQYISRDLQNEWAQLIKNEEHVLEAGTYVGGVTRGRLRSNYLQFLWTSFIDRNAFGLMGNDYGFCDYYYNRMILNSEFIIIPFIKVIENTKFSLNAKKDTRLHYPIHISAVKTTLSKKIATISCRCYEGIFSTSMSKSPSEGDYRDTFFINNKKSSFNSSTSTKTLENIFQGDTLLENYDNAVNDINAYSNSDCRYSWNCDRTSYVSTFAAKSFTSRLGDPDEYWGTYPFRREFTPDFSDEQTKINISADIHPNIFIGSTGVEPLVKVSSPIITGCNVRILKETTQ